MLVSIVLFVHRQKRTRLCVALGTAPVIGKLQERRPWRNLLQLIAGARIVHVPADLAFEFRSVRETIHAASDQ
jgi:hypothetical protein